MKAPIAVIDKHVNAEAITFFWKVVNICQK